MLLSNVDKTHRSLVKNLIQIISETNGISIADTLKLLTTGDLSKKDSEIYNLITDFQDLLTQFSTDQVPIHALLEHPVSHALHDFFKLFPIKYNEEHIHLTGSLNAEFIFPRLNALLNGPNKEIYKKKIIEVYGAGAWPIQNVQDVDRLIRLKPGEGFDKYLKILYLPKLILVDKNAHRESAYHLAKELYLNYNVGKIRLKFMLSRASSSSEEQVPGSDTISSEDVILGLYEGFKKFQSEHSDFNFVLSPSFRKEKTFFDSARFKTRKEHFESQINELVALMEKYPYLIQHVTDVDTVGNEMDLYRKEHFFELHKGFRKLQYRGFKIRSHHGETFRTLKKGIQAVDNAMNIWHIDTLEHGLALGINPNFYFHQVYQRVIEKNRNNLAVAPNDFDYMELVELDWGSNKEVLDLLLNGKPLTEEQRILFLKAKFHTAREVEHYQHDVLNRLIQKGVTLVSLPSSNTKLTGRIRGYKDHPFSWWEKKGIQLSVGTDNYVTLDTNYIEEMLILLYTDPENLKITKLLMVTTGESRRPHLSHLLWSMRKKYHD